MVVRPEDRPQSISEWTALLDTEFAEDTDEGDESATRVGNWDTTTPSIVPVAPAKGGSGQLGKIKTGGPDTPSTAELNRRADEEKGKPKLAPTEKPAKKEKRARGREA